MIQLLKPKIHELSIKLVSQVLRSGWIGLGPMVTAFEKKISAYLNVKDTVALNSGTDALRCAVALCGAKPGSVFISTPNTFVSTNHVLIEAGYKLHFADIDPTDGMITPESIYRILKSGVDVGGIMVVHYGGMPCDLGAISSIAKEFGVPLIEDAAHAFGAEYHGRKVGGSTTTFGCFSLHAVKPLCVGDGGLLTTNSAKIAEAARRWRWLGISKSTIDRADHTKYSWNYDVVMLGHKSHMNDITAAIGCGQLANYPGDSKLRQQLVDLYMAKIYPPVLFLTPRLDCKSANHLMVILCKDSKHRAGIVKKLTENDIQTGLHYKPNYLYKMYKDVPRENNTKGCEEFYSRALTLPLHLEMTGSDIELIAEVINEV